MAGPTDPTATDPKLLLYIVGLFAVIYSMALAALIAMGWAAFRNPQGKSGGNPDSAKVFGLLFERAVPMITVALVVLALVVLALINRLGNGALGVLGSIAAYVLGSSASKKRPPKPTPVHPTTRERGDNP